MKTIRVFMVAVSGCDGCPSQLPDGSDGDIAKCWHNDTKPSDRIELASENWSAITPSCPRYAETKLIEGKE